MGLAPAAWRVERTGPQAQPFLPGGRLLGLIISERDGIAGVDHRSIQVTICTPCRRRQKPPVFVAATRFAGGSGIADQGGQMAPCLSATKPVPLFALADLLGNSGASIPARRDALAVEHQRDRHRQPAPSPTSRPQALRRTTTSPRNSSISAVSRRSRMIRSICFHFCVEKPLDARSRYGMGKRKTENRSNFLRIPP